VYSRILVFWVFINIFLVKILSKDSILKDLNAGLVVFLVALPLCLGIALASKAPLMSGIIAGILGGIVVGAFSGSQLGVSGPAAGLVAIVIAGIAKLGSFEVFCLATLLAGGLQLILGLVRAGSIAQYFPTSVIKGMLAAIGIIIILKQIPHFCGLDSDYEGDLDFFQSDGHNTLSELGYLFDALTPGAILIGSLGLATMILWNRPRVQQNRVLSMIPGPLIAVVLGIGFQFLFEKTGSSMALAPEHLVQIKASTNPITWLSKPDFSAIGNPDVWTYAVLIGVIASVESLLCAEATDKIDPLFRVANKNKELLAQGLGNALSGLVGGLPITQVIVRSSANVQAGGQTRLSTIIHGLLLFLSVIAFPFVLNEIPMTSLAAVLLMVGYNLAKPSLFVKYYNKGWQEFIPFFTTITAVLFTDLLIGVGVGIVNALLFILRRSFRAPYTYHLAQVEDMKIVKLKLASIVGFFNKGVIIETLEMIPDGSRVILDASGSGFIDPDIVEVIEDFAKGAANREITFELIGTLQHAAISKNPASDLRKHLSGAKQAAEAAQAKPMAQENVSRDSKSKK
jgi:MFS superfamily sulfate permease-like transporter